MSKKIQAALIVLTIGVLACSPTAAQQTTSAEREAMYRRYLELPSYVKGGSIKPHWMADGSGFWYAEGVPANTVIWKVDPHANSQAALFDTLRLRQAVAGMLGYEPSQSGLPFAEFTFVEGEKAVKFTVEGETFTRQCRPESPLGGVLFQADRRRNIQVPKGGQGH